MKHVLKKPDGRIAVVGGSSDERVLEANYRLVNGLQLATAMLRHEGRTLTDAASARVALEGAALRLMAMARLHARLCRSGPEADVELGRFLKPIREEIEASVGVAILLRACDVAVPVETATEIAVLLSELATNAAKHGCVAGAGATVAVDIVRNGHQTLRIMIEDDGPGLPDGFEMASGKGLGRGIVAQTVERLGGSIRVVPSVGAAFEIDIPLDVPVVPDRAA